MLARIDALGADIADLNTQIEAQIAPFADAVARLDEIPGVGATAAAVIIAEVGVDMTRFPTPAHLSSWARFAPGVKESAGRKKGTGSTGHGDRYLARALGEAAVSASKTNTFLGERYLSTTSAPATTTHGSTQNIRSATTSANSKPSATRSLCNPPPDPPEHRSHRYNPIPAPLRYAGMLSRVSTFHFRTRRVESGRDVSAGQTPAT